MANARKTTGKSEPAIPAQPLTIPLTEWRDKTTALLQKSMIRALCTGTRPRLTDARSSLSFGSHSW